MPKKKKKVVKVVDIVATKKEPHRVKNHREEPEYDRIDETPDMGALLHSETYKDNVFEEHVEKPSHAKQKKWRRTLTWTCVVCIPIIILVYIGITKLPKTDIVITMKKTEVSYEELIFVKTAIGKTDASTKRIPGEIISKKANKLFEFTPTGKQTNQEKATGKITIYNTYSSAPQVLIATTRFETPQGKIYRLVNRVTVPGAPGSIEADIIADGTGESYNTESVQRLTIPGFKGTPKFEKFYGSIQSPITIHSIHATEEDIATAQKKGEEELRRDLMSLVQVQIPTHMRLVSGSEEFNLIERKITSSQTNKNSMNMVLEAEIKVFAINEKHIREFIQTLALRAEAIDARSSEKTFSISYGKPETQYILGSMTLPISVQATYWKELDTKELQREIAGKKEEALKSSILSKEGVDRVSVSFWPFWVSKAPTKTDRIHITTE